MSSHAQSTRRLWAATLLAAACAIGAASPVRAQPAEPAEPSPAPAPAPAPETVRIERLPAPDAEQPGDAQPGAAQPGDKLDTPAPVRALLDASFNTPDEARALRLRFGRPTAEDLAGPERLAARAHIALLGGAPKHPSLSDPATPAPLRAQALLALGRAPEALALLENLPPAEQATIAHARLRVQALLLAGRTEQALALGVPAANAVLGGRVQPAELVDGVHLIAELLRVMGPQTAGLPAGADHQRLMALLGQARAADPLDWRVPLAEAQLLHDKDNFAQAQAAAIEALNLNPACAPAWLLMGQMAVGGFDFDAAERLAGRLDRAAQVADAGVDALTHDQAPASAQGDIVRARALLRQDGADVAKALIEKHLALAPGTPDLLAVLAACQAGLFDFDALARALDAYERAFPGPPGAGAAHLAGEVLADQRQYEQSARTLERAMRLAPRWGQPATALGLVLVQAGQDERAQEALTVATGLDPFNVRASNSLKLLRELAKYERIESEHFVVRALPGVDALLAREMLPVLERAHADVSGTAPGALRHTMRARTTIELHPSHARFAVRIAGMPRLHTIAASTGPVIAMEAPRDGPGHSGAYDWARVIQHEYVHTVGLERTGNRMPHWFTEAQAVYLERRPRDHATVQLLAATVHEGDLFDLDEISIAFTRPKRPQDRALAYAQGHWMYQFIVETFGPEAPLKLMDEFARGVRQREAIGTVLARTPQAFMDEFASWARGQLVAWGEALPAGTPDLAQVLSEAAGQPVTPDDATAEHIERALQAHPGRADVLELAVRRAIEATGGQLGNEHVALLTQYAEARPHDPLPHRHLARYWLGPGADAAKAVAHLTWLDAREEREPAYAAHAAALVARAGELDEGARLAERAVQIAPYSAQQRELAATIAVQRKDWPTARRHLVFLGALEPDNTRHRQRLDALTRLESAGN
jgi:tetratricopeptide (TPR) repeat protein